MRKVKIFTYGMFILINGIFGLYCLYNGDKLGASVNLFISTYFTGMLFLTVRYE